MKPNNFLTGITLIRNGNILKYPFMECIRNLASKCDEVLVNVGKSEDNTLQCVYQLQKYFKNIRVFESYWDMSNTGDGSELAKQANLLLPFVNSKWVVYLQADEFLHWEEHKQFYKYLDLVPDNVQQIELYRTYFYKDLNTRKKSEEIYLGRIFRPGTHRIGGDGMYIEPIVNSPIIMRSPYWIYHYSRMGNEKDIDRRVKNLDILFHDPEKVKDFPVFKYQTDGLIPYNGSHPEGIQEFYRGNNE